VSGCGGGGFGVSTEGSDTAWVAVSLSGALVALAVGGVPWLRPAWLRWILALGIGIAVALAAVPLTGGPTP